MSSLALCTVALSAVVLGWDVGATTYHGLEQVSMRGRGSEGGGGDGGGGGAAERGHEMRVSGEELGASAAGGGRARHGKERAEKGKARDGENEEIAQRLTRQTQYDPIRGSQAGMFAVGTARVLWQATSGAENARRQGTGKACWEGLLFPGRLCFRRPTDAPAVVQ